MKRLFDVLTSLIGLILTAPLLIPICILIWLQDYGSPFYIAPRVGKHNKIFNIIKLRSMILNTEKVGIDSTSKNDDRITHIGKFIRSYKLDEIPQLWNVLKGDMSIVGPRPNVQRETDIYTHIEKYLLSVKPGITDISSIVFSDLGEVLKDSKNPNIDYNQLVRPWKSRLGLLYINNRSFILDIKLIVLTIIAISSRKKALAGVQKILDELGADEMLKQIARREEKLKPFPPPGSNVIVTSRRA